MPSPAAVSVPPPAHTHRALLAAYPNLNQPELSRQAMVAAEDALFEHIYDMILPLYRYQYSDTDARLTSKMTTLTTQPPSFFGVSEKFWLLPQAEEELEPEETPPPYEDAIHILQRFTHAATPTDKAAAIGPGPPPFTCAAAACLPLTVTKHDNGLCAAVAWAVDTIQEIVRCVHTYWTVRGVDASMAALSVCVLVPRAVPGLLAGLAFLWVFLFIPFLAPLRSSSVLMAIVDP